MPPEPLTTASTLESLGIDSLAAVELLWTVEDEFKIVLPSAPVYLLTLGDVVRCVEHLLAAQGVVGAMLQAASLASSPARCDGWPSAAWA